MGYHWTHCPGNAILNQKDFVRSQRNFGKNGVYTIFQYPFAILRQTTGFFSNSDTEGQLNLNEMFANKNVDGILCAKGDYGCTKELCI